MSKPDILFIITDHHSWHGHFAGPDGRPGGISPQGLPVWERFCSEGTLFAQANSCCPLCTPARASMMSGLAPTRHGMLMNCDGGGDFRSGTELFTHHLSRAGYRNAYVGKWHAGHERLPLDFGIEGWALKDYGVLYTSERYRQHCAEHGLGEARALIEHSVNRPEYEGTVQTLDDSCPWHHMNASGVMQGPRIGHESDAVAAWCCGQLRELTAGEQPFAMVASFWAPHAPYYPTEPFAGMIDPATIPEHPSFRDDMHDKPSRWVIHRELHHGPSSKRWRSWADWQPIMARVYEQALQTDAAVGRLLDELERSGRADNTIVIWCADHGDSTGGHGGLWDKANTMSEDVMRIPLAVRWPKALPAGQVVDDPVSNLDCPATILEAAGCAVPEAWDSRSLLPVIRGKERRADVVCEHHGHGPTQVEQRMLRSGRWKYVAALYDGDELYDLEADPWELDNRIADPARAELVAGFRRRLSQHLDTEPRSALQQRLQVSLAL